MRKSILCAIVVACALTLSGEPMKKTERQRVVSHLEMTRSWFIDEASHLSPAQLNFKPAPEVWSIAEVVEHLRLAEPIYWKQLKDALTADSSGKKPVATDNDILWYGIDRSDRQKTEAQKSPHGEPVDVAKGLDAFRKLHDEILEYARTTQDDLRGHILASEGVDDYQWLLGISAHTQRHILQIREVKANPNFPKK